MSRQPERRTEFMPFEKKLSHDQACELFRLALEHAGREEDALANQLAVGKALRAALLAGHGGRLEEIARQAAAAGGDLSSERARFRETAAAMLGVAARDVTLSAVAGALLPGQEEVMTRRQLRLRQLAAEVEQLCQSNAALIYYGLDFLQRFLADLTGEAAGGRYGAAGQHLKPSRGPIIQLRG